MCLRICRRSAITRRTGRRARTIRYAAAAVLAAQQLERDGVVLVPGAISEQDRASIEPVADKLLTEGGSGAGRRNVLRLSPEIADLAAAPALLDVAQSLLSSGAQPVKALLFEKNEQTNWLVPWHQDQTIAVRARNDVEGYGPWSEKDGVPHVQAPVEVLRRMVAIRVHLDDATAANGALRVIPGSHQFGKLTPERLEEIRETHAQRVCEASAGDLLVFKPLLVHGSPKATHPERRRILHIEYSDADLGGGLEWAT